CDSSLDSSRYGEDSEQWWGTVHWRENIFKEGEKKEQRRRSPSQASSCSASVFSRLGAKRQKQRRKDSRELIRIYVTCSSERQRENKREYQKREREDSRDEPLESKDSIEGRHWKRQSRKAQKKKGRTCLNLTTRNPPPFSPEESTNIEDHPVVIRAEIGGHGIHKMYVAVGSALEILANTPMSILREVPVPISDMDEILGKEDEEKLPFTPARAYSATQRCPLGQRMPVPHTSGYWTKLLTIK
nr:hypothetical protein [Tanacetum cinerariifolium]